MRDYQFQFEEHIYVVGGDMKGPPEFIVLLDKRVVRVAEVLETCPPQIGAVEEVPSAPAKARLPR